MKKTTFTCDPLQPRAMLALQTHRDTYIDGMCVYFNGRSRNALYFDLGYVIYETKTTVVIREMK
jgi:hypothetical protein